VKRESARKHAKRVHACPVCRKRCRGNGGWASHRRAHARRGEGPKRWRELVDAPIVRELMRMLDEQEAAASDESSPGAVEVVVEVPSGLGEVPRD
jgi:hypothetical protein